MKFFCIKSDGVLIGADSDAQEALASLGAGTFVECHTNKNRNYKNLQRFFVFRDTAFDIQSDYTDKEEFRKWLTMKAGYYNIIHSPKKDKIQFEPKSISYAAEIDEEEFKLFFNKCVTTFINEFNVNMTSNDFWEIASFGN